MIVDSILSIGALRSLSSLRFSIVLAAALLLVIPTGEVVSAQAGSDNPLADTFDAHGGLEKWSDMKTMTYTMDGFPLNPQVAEHCISTVDLRTRNNRIESEGYTVGFNGKQAWAVPGRDAVGLPPRFYSLGSFYFIGMPFVFGDEGTVVTDGGTGEFKGKTYRVLNVGFNKGTGFTSKDSYAVFIDPETDLLALIHHSVSELGVDRVTWVFDEWQEVDGILVPAKFTYYPGWNPDDPGEGAVTLIRNVEFSRTSPAPSIYNPPANAQIDNAPELH